MLFLKEAYRFFLLNYVVREGRHFFRYDFWQHLLHDAVDVHLPNVDDVDLTPLARRVWAEPHRRDASTTVTVPSTGSTVDGGAVGDAERARRADDGGDAELAGQHGGVRERTAVRRHDRAGDRQHGVEGG